MNVASLCRLDKQISHDLLTNQGTRLLLMCTGTIMFMSGLFGASFGMWCSIQQMIYAAIKMPAMVISVVLLSAMGNTVLAQALGARLSFRQVCTCMLLGFAIMSTLLASFTPITIFALTNAAGFHTEAAVHTYPLLLLMNTGLVALAGSLGVLKLYQLLITLTHSRTIARRVLTAWLGVCGLVGSELSWLFSPFLARPGVPTPFINPNAFSSNFFEYLWEHLMEFMTY